MDRTATPTKGNTTSAMRAKRHSRTSMTMTSAITIATCRMAMTMTVDDTRASRFTSVITRDMRSAECTSAKNDSGICWMCRYRAPRRAAITRSPTAAIRYDWP